MNLPSFMRCYESVLMRCYESALEQEGWVTHRDIISNFACRLRCIKGVSVGWRVGGQLGVTVEGRIIVVIRHEKGFRVKAHQESLPFAIRPYSSVRREPIVNLHSNT